MGRIRGRTGECQASATAREHAALRHLRRLAAVSWPPVWRQGAKPLLGCDVVAADQDESVGGHAVACEHDQDRKEHWLAPFRLILGTELLSPFPVPGRPCRIPPLEMLSGPHLDPTAVVRIGG